MPAHRVTWSWSPPAREEARTGSRSLSDRLGECAEDRTASARAVVLEAAQELKAWLNERPCGWGRSESPLESIGLELEDGWREWSRSHTWRGPCALFLDTLRQTFFAARSGAAQGDVHAALQRELEHWLEPASGDTAWSRDSRHGELSWSGEPHAPGARMPARESVAVRALATLDTAESILVHGYSETVLRALIAAHTAGKLPRVSVGAGAPDQSGKRLARELAERGVNVRVLWDAVALGSASAADRIWLGTEAIAPEGFVGLVGTRLLLEEAERAEVPVTVLCTVDKWMPGGVLELPAWGAADTWNLWSYAPEEAELDSQPFEVVSADAVNHWITERGSESLGEFSVRGMRVETAAPCGSR